MTLARLWRHRATRHVLAWLLLSGGLVASVLLLPVPKQPHELTRLFGGLALLVPPVYAHLWLLTHALERGRRGLYLAGTAAVLVAGALLDAAPTHFSITVADAAGTKYDLADFANSLLGIAVALLLSAMLRYLRRGIVSRYQVQELHARQLETELSLLKAQVNQHFLFNTLNNLYGLSLAAPAQMPEALLQLAGLMRYQLDSSRQATVTVGTEAEYLANYIGLEKLRLRANTQVEFVADLTHPDRPLAPLLLLPLVENCFKHAIGPSGPNTIRICLTQTDAGLTLRTDNSIPPHFQPAPSGLGLPTLRARLTRFYPGRAHRFRVEATATHYTATLLLSL